MTLTLSSTAAIAAPLAVVADTVRATIAAVDDSVKVMRVAPFADLLDRPLARPRFNAALLALFGATALALSAIGLYAVMAASVQIGRASCREGVVAAGVAGSFRI